MSEPKWFLSYHFATDQERAKSTLQLAEAFGYKVITGEDLGPITPEVTARINACDVLVAVVTRGSKKPGRKGRGSPSLGDRRADPRPRTKQAHRRPDGHRGEDRGAVHGERAHRARPGLPTAAFIKLARMLSLWRRVELCTLKVIILPGELAAKLRGDDVRCQFRFRHENWIGPWQEAFIH